MPEACPSTDVLVAVLRELQPAETERALAAHLSDCASCRARLDQLAGGSNWIEAKAHKRARLIRLQQNTGALQPLAPSSCLEQVMDKLKRYSETTSDSNADPLLTTETRQLFFGDYEILEELDRGGMGVVYKARQVGLKRTVALKLILAGHLASDKEVQRFHNEAKAAARLDHPNIVPIYEIGEHDGRCYFSMKLIEGRPLSSCIAELRSEKSRHDIVRLATQMARAVHYAHQHGILHRDLKPGNILLDANDEPHLADFGLAKILGTDSNLTLSVAVMGTPNYMAPEIALGKARAVTTGADVFSLGAILYELLTGRPPFQAKTAAATLDQVVRVDPNSPRAIDPDVPRDLATICLKCLEKEPARRYSSAAAVAEELDRFSRSEPILARPNSAPERLWRWCQRKPALAGLLLGLHVVMALGLAGILWEWHRAEQSVLAESHQRRIAERESHRALEAVTRLEIDRVESLFQAGDSSQALALLARLQRSNPSNRVVAARLMSALVDRNYCLPVAPLPHGPSLNSLTAEQRQTMGTYFPFRYPGSIVCANVSPDGNTIVTASEDGTARLWDARTGQPLASPLRHRAEVMWASFSPDSRKVVTASLDGSARVWDVRTGLPVTPPLVHPQAVWHAEFSPDGEKVVTACLDKTARIWDAHNGRPLGEPMVHVNYTYYASFSRDGGRILTASRPRSVALWNADTGARIWAQDHFFFRESTLPFPRLNPVAAQAVTLRAFSAYLRQASTNLMAIARLNHEDYVLAAAFSPDGAKVATASMDTTARIWSTDTGQALCRPLRHNGWVFSALFSDDGSLLATASRDGTARLWSTRTGRPVVEPLSHSSPVLMARTAVHGRRVVTVDESNTAWLWSVPPLRRAGLFVECPQEVELVRFSPDGRRIVIGMGDTANVLDSHSGQKIAGPLQHAPGEPIYDAEFSPDGKFLATASANGDARLWHVDRASTSFLRLPHDDEVRSVRFSADGTRLVTAADDGTARVWDVSSGKLLLTLIHSRSVRYAEFNHDGTAIATASWDGSARVWDAGTGQPITPPLLHDGEVNWVGFSPNGNRIATASSDKTVRLWDAHTGQQLVNPLVHNDELTGLHSVQFSPDGTRLVTAAGNLAQVWDAITGKALIAQVRLAGRINSVRFIADGTRFVTACSDGAVCQWDTKTGEEISETSFHQAKAAYAAFSPDGKRLLTCSSDKTVRIQNVVHARLPVPGWLPDLAESLAGRRLNDEEVSEDVPVEKLYKLSQRLAASSGSDYYTKWSRRILSADFRSSSTAVLTGAAPSTKGIARQAGWNGEAWHVVFASKAALINRMRQHAAEGYWDEAAKEWTQAIDLSVDNYHWWAPRKRICEELHAWPEVFRRVSQLRPKESALWIGRGRYYALRGRWAAAATNYARAFRSRSICDEAIFEYAGALLLTGDVEGYRRVCTNLAAASAEAGDFCVAFVKARTCGIAPVESVPPQQLVDWAAECVKDDQRPWMLHVLGLAYYRAGDFQRAIETLEQSNALPWDDPAPALNSLVLAMAHQRLGNTDEARRWLQKAQRAIQLARPKVPNGASDFFAPDVIAVELLRREAEALIQ